MQSAQVTVVVPTMAGDRRLLDCLASLEAQTLPGVQIVVVDNSGAGRFHSLGAGRFRFRLIENPTNVGFGAAINQGFRLCPAPFLATLNDDAIAGPRWLEAAINALQQDPRAGMAAARITLASQDRLDSAGMLIARDGSSKQRGHLQPPTLFNLPEETLLPSGCAAVYRAAMLHQIGLFQEDFFLYCEDTDLGLRAQWAGWGCLYVPDARVQHHYSQSAGAASQLKVWFVERNRLRLAVRCFPLSWLLAGPFCAAMRYLWHVVSILQGRGKAAEFHHAGGSFLQLPWIVIKAHLQLLRDLPQLLRQRAAIPRRRTPAEFIALLRRHHISLRQVASL